MTAWDYVRRVVVGKDFGARDQGARILAVSLCLAIFLLVVAAMANALRAPDGLSDGLEQLLIGTLTLLVGTVSGYLARRQDEQEEDSERAPVGTVLTVALGLAMLVLTGVSAYDAIFGPDPGLSANMATLLAAVLGGSIGAAAAYLGLPRPDLVTAPPRTQQGTAAPLPGPEEQTPRGPDL